MPYFLQINIFAGKLKEKNYAGKNQQSGIVCREPIKRQA